MSDQEKMKEALIRFQEGKQTEADIELVGKMTREFPKMWAALSMALLRWMEMIVPVINGIIDAVEKIQMELHEEPGFEGAAEEASGQPQHGDSGTCAVCGGEIEFYEDAVYPVGNGEKEVLTTWWAHRVHPADGHNAVLGGPA